MAKKTTRREAMDALEESQARMEIAGDFLERAGALQDRAGNILAGEDDPMLDDDERPTWGDIEEAIAELAEKGPKRGQEPEDAASEIMQMIEDYAEEGWPDEPPETESDVPEWIPRRIGDTLAEYGNRRGFQSELIDKLPDIVGAIVRNLRRPAGPGDRQPDQNPPSESPGPIIDMERVD